MVCKKDTGKNAVSLSRQGIEVASEDEFLAESGDKDSVPLDSRAGQREKCRKRRTPEEMEADARVDWVSSIPGKGFKSEANQQEEFWQR